MPNNSFSAETSGMPLILRNRGQTLAVILLIAIVAIGAAIYFWRSQHVAVSELSVARTQASRAEENFKATRSAIDTVLSDSAIALQQRTGSRPGRRRPFSPNSNTPSIRLVIRTQKNPELRRSQASMCVQFSTTYPGDKRYQAGRRNRAKRHGDFPRNGRGAAE